MGTQIPTPAETLAKERVDPPFDLTEMKYALGGGKKSTLIKERVMLELERDPNFRLDDIHDLTKDQIRERTMIKFRSILHAVTTENLDIFHKRLEVIGIADPAFWTRFGVHYGLFFGAIRSGATPNQFSYWIEKGVLGLNGMVGCFGMTELGHGSNVAGLETTATFDEPTDEFVIHTPSVSATKWWIGGAAQSATHCAVFARLRIRGKDYGTKTFIVPLRNPHTYDLLPGINIGDIGKKMGRDGIDNGWIQFTNVRIPRAYMLMKHTQVTRDGQVFEPALAQLTYGALLQGRTSMVADASNVAKKALTIAVRYGAVRRQFTVGKNTLESQLLDYPIHQRRLLPLMAQAIAMGFVSIRMTALYESMTEEMESLSPDADPVRTKEVLEILKETHATSAGLKAFCTWSALETIEKCRASLGGHGYSAYAGLSSMYNDQAVQCTWEGDNTVLTLQAGRALISALEDAHKGKTLPDGYAYLNGLEKVLDARAGTEATGLATMSQGWDTVAAHAIVKAHEVYAAGLKSGKGKDDALESCSQERFVAAKLHTVGYIYKQFLKGIDDLDRKSSVIPALKEIATLYGAWAIEENAQYFLKCAFYTPAQIDEISGVVNASCAAVRKYAVLLTDAFNLSDHIINSPLGIYSGDVYKAYFDRVQAANPYNPVHPYFTRIIKPLIERESSDLVDTSDINLDEEIEEILQERKEAK